MASNRMRCAENQSALSPGQLSPQRRTSTSSQHWGSVRRTPSSKCSNVGICRTPNFVERQRLQLAKPKHNPRKKRTRKGNQENSCSRPTPARRMQIAGWKPQSLCARHFDEEFQEVSADPYYPIYFPIAAKASAVTKELEMETAENMETGTPGNGVLNSSEQTIEPAKSPETIDIIILNTAGDACLQTSEETRGPLSPKRASGRSMLSTGNLKGKRRMERKWDPFSQEPVRRMKPSEEATVAATCKSLNYIDLEVLHATDVAHCSPFGSVGLETTEAAADHSSFWISRTAHPEVAKETKGQAVNLEAEEEEAGEIAKEGSARCIHCSTGPRTPSSMWFLQLNRHHSTIPMEGQQGSRPKVSVPDKGVPWKWTIQKAVGKEKRLLGYGKFFARHVAVSVLLSMVLHGLNKANEVADVDWMHTMPAERMAEAADDWWKKESPLDTGLWKKESQLGAGSTTKETQKKEPLVDLDIAADKAAEEKKHLAVHRQQGELWKIINAEKAAPEEEPRLAPEKAVEEKARTATAKAEAEKKARAAVEEQAYLDAVKAVEEEKAGLTAGKLKEPTLDMLTSKKREPVHFSDMWLTPSFVLATPALAVLQWVM